MSRSFSPVCRFACACLVALSCSPPARAAQYPDLLYADGFQCRTWYPDADADGFGVASGATSACVRPAGFALRVGDCDDGNAAINPGAVDLPDDAFIDSDCDGLDGAIADGVFVATDGVDANPGTKAFPLQTIAAALVKAAAAGKRFVYISAGTYAGSVTLDATNQGIGLHGGYLRASDWARNGTRAQINGPRTGALRVDGVTQATIVEYLHFVAAAATVPGTSSYAIVVSDSTGFTPRYVTATAGNGMAGSAGANAGMIGTKGGDGTTGASGFEDDSYFFCVGDQTDPPLTYPGGSTCGAVASTKGGDGHRGCITNGSSCAGSPGDAGSPNPVGSASDGGMAFIGGPGGNGQAGAEGLAGSDGDAGAGGAVVDGEWVGAAGGSGGLGGAGSGGGGGAGGGSTHSTGTCNDWGGGGGGGGGGGCGGTGGDGGNGGGASIAILLVNSAVTASHVSVETGAGGKGGDGRDGGAFGAGGLGRNGGAGYDEGKSGGPGADGGHGGRGGHGGGGAGGWVVGVYRDASTWSDAGSTNATLGVPGSGGASSGNAGVAGSAYSIY